MPTHRACSTNRGRHERDGTPHPSALPRSWQYPRRRWLTGAAPGRGPQYTKIGDLVRYPLELLNGWIESNIRRTDEHQTTKRPLALLFPGPRRSVQRQHRLGGHNTKRKRREGRGGSAEVSGSTRQGTPTAAERDALLYRRGPFVEWAKGEYGAKPNTWKRLRGSTTSLKAYFKNKPVHNISAGDIEDYKSWRRRAGVEEVTLRHDLHALSPLLRYARKHNWCAGNPLETVEVPSDAESERINVLSPAEELLYFELAKRQSIELHDLAAS